MKRIALFGAAPDTPNMGVTALFSSVVSGLAEIDSQIEVIVFDNGLGLRDDEWLLPDGKILRLTLYGARAGLKYYRPENLLNMEVCSRLGSIGAKINKGIALIDSCDAVLDISGGDSFSDIYGRKRFYSVIRPKQIAINRRKPLILLPQTYGPYFSKKLFRKASEIVKQSSQAWARDPDSFEILKKLLGDQYSESQHHSGIDVAFGLKTEEAYGEISSGLKDLLNSRSPDKPLVGINISGLIYNNPEGAKNRYKFSVDYNMLVLELITELLSKSNANILLVPHVVDKRGHFESDLSACDSVFERIPEKFKGRIEIAPIFSNPSKVKWLISNMDWFCGTRMHSTIAGLSSGVPTSTISYSDKALGVFKSCQQTKNVFDPRIQTKDEIVLGLFQSFLERNETKYELKKIADKIGKNIKRQLECIIELGL